jgi:hypothetical protein
MTPKGDLVTAPGTLYRNGPRCLLILIDLQRPGAEQRLHRELAAWRGFARSERLLDGYVALVVRPGGAVR